MRQRDFERGEQRRALAPRVLAAFERVLWIGGVLCLSFYTVACVHASWKHGGEAARFEQSVALAIAAERPDQRDWSATRVARFDALRDAEAAALGRLEIPAAGVSVMLLEGTEDAVLDRAVGRIEGTAAPGHRGHVEGNMGIAGHRDSYFRGLGAVNEGDPIFFASLSGIARYEIVSTRVVEPEAVEVLDPTAEPTITLVTCYPFRFLGNAPQRFIVQARRVGFEAWAPDEPVDAQLAQLRADDASRF